MKRNILTIAVLLFSTFLMAQDYSASQNGNKRKIKKEIKKEEVINSEVVNNVKTDSKSTWYRPRYEFGIASGLTTGYGFTYKFWPKKLGFQLTAFPVVSDEDKNLSVGLLSLYELDSKSWYRIFAFVGGNFNWTENSDYDEFYDSPMEPVTFLFNLNAPFEEQKKFTIGAGPGVEFTPGKHFGINLMTGFRYTSIDYAYSRDEKLVTLTADIAIYFRF